MTVQVSVTIWTILCFLALMLILDRLLFRPLLSFMDRRREKIDRAREEKTAALRARDEALEQREQARLDGQRRAMDEAARSLESLHDENARRLAEKRAENERALETLGAALAEESEKILAGAEPRMDDIVRAMAGSLSGMPEGGVIKENAET